MTDEYYNVCTKETTRNDDIGTIEPELILEDGVSDVTRDTAYAYPDSNPITGETSTTSVIQKCSWKDRVGSRAPFTSVQALFINGELLMKRIAYVVVALTLVFALPIHAQEEDAEGCTDHPLFTRMTGSLIASCESNDFNAYTFKTGSEKTVDVEGKYWVLSYYMKEGLKSTPRVIQILRNFENAVKQSGGKLIFLNTEEDKETLQLKKNGKEFWVEVYANITGRHTIIIVEKAGMVQDVVANADAFSNDLKASGHAAVYGIYFDSGKSEIKPESEKAIGEIARLLKGEAGLGLYCGWPYGQPGWHGCQSQAVQEQGGCGGAGAGAETLGSRHPV